MAKLEHLQPSAALKGILADSLVTVVNVQWFGSAALELTYATLFLAGITTGNGLLDRRPGECTKLRTTPLQRTYRKESRYTTLPTSRIRGRSLVG